MANFEYHLGGVHKLLNCFGEALATREYVGEWIRRIGAVPEALIGELCQQGVAAARVSPSQLGEAVGAFLVKRRRQLANVLSAPGVLPLVTPERP